MKTPRSILILLLTLGSYYTTLRAQEKTEVLIVGGGAGGTAAAIQAARSGAKVTVLETTEWLGGMLTSAGVSAIDGNHRMPSGIWGAFRDSLYQRYGGAKGVATGWVSHTLFEPSVGKTIFEHMAQHPNITVHYNANLTDIRPNTEGWQLRYSKKGKAKEIQAKIVLDGTETGALLPKVGAAFRLGMDSKSDTGEKEAPEVGNSIVQDMTYVAILKDVKTKKGRKGMVKKPKHYDAKHYACACKREGGEMFGAVSDCQQMLNYGKLPNDKYMINWPNCGNDYFVDWPNMNPDQRAAALEKAKEFTQGFVYYIQQELGFSNLRLAEEFPTKDHFPMIPYDREARRAKGKVFLTVDHLERPYDHTYYRTGVAVGDYPIDHHHDKNPEAPEIAFINIKVPSYNIPLGTLIPEQVPNLIMAEKNISVSNIVNGATRLQPVVLGIGQAAGALAALSVAMGLRPDQVPVRSLQSELLKHGAYIMPFIDVDRDHPHFSAVQRIGATGILKGRGIPYKWANETWFYPDQYLSEYDIWEGLRALYPALENLQASGKPLTLSGLTDLLLPIDGKLNEGVVTNAFTQYLKRAAPAPDQRLTRLETAVLLDALLHPFEIAVDIQGTLKPNSEK